LKQDSITFIDFGVGFDQQSFEDIFCNILESTKDNSNDELGMWGLGSKSAFSYTDQFTVTSVKDGTERMWVVRKENQGNIQADLIFCEPTSRVSKGNTTEVQIKIKDGDFHQFKSEIRNQLKFFVNVFVRCDYDPTFAESFNDASIFDGKHFKSSDLDGSYGVMSLCLGVVEYPIDFKFLGISTINLPVSIKFNIGEVGVTPSREGILWDSSIKEVVINRIEAALGEIKSMYESTNKDTTDDIIVYQDSIRKDKELVLDNGTVLEMSVLKNYSTDFEVISTSYVGILPKKFTVIPQTQLKVKHSYGSGQNRLETVSYSIANVRDAIVSGSGFTYKRKNSRLFKYVDQKVENTPFFVRFNRVPSNYKVKNKKGDLVDISSKELIAWNNEIQRLEEKYDVLNKFPNIPAEDLERFKVTTKNRVGEEEFVGGWGRDWNAYDVSFKKENINIDSLEDMEETVFYGDMDSRDTLKGLHFMNYSVILTAKTNFKHMEELNNFFHVSKMYESMDIKTLAQKSVDSRAIGCDQTLTTLFKNRGDINVITNGGFDKEISEEIEAALRLEGEVSLNSYGRELLFSIEEHFKPQTNVKLKEISGRFGHLENIKYLRDSDSSSSRTNSHIHMYGAERKNLDAGAISFMKHFDSLVNKSRKNKK
jgi:hypothetical protein